MVVLTKSKLAVPNVLIQDSILNKYYHVTGKTLINFETDSELSENSVHFYIPSDELIDTILEYENTDISTESNVVIHFPDANKTFELSRNVLATFEITPDQVNDIKELSVAFIIPTGDDLLERTPRMNPAMLQSGTAPTET